MNNYFVKDQIDYLILISMADPFQEAKPCWKLYYKHDVFKKVFA